ncbi:unnamed protein product [Colias eurytheme]|nr:unnamed protein product [Colias eurytheme]
MAGKSNGVDSSGWARAPPEAGPLWQRVCKAIYNPQEKSFLGRTPKRWGIVLAFYLIFYAVLAVLFATCMGVLFLTLDDKKPKFVLDSSLIGANPGVAFRPTAGFGLRYKNTNTSTYDVYVDDLKDFFSDYKAEDWYSAKKDCKADDNFGYPDTPCFFIKLNKIYGWKPEYYDVNSLPEDMPSDLQEHIGALQELEHHQIWVSCKDENVNATNIEYPWGRGLPGRFYPYLNVEGYLSPVIAVKVTSIPNAQIAIRCRAWAKNIHYNKSLKEPSGYTRILLYIEDTTSFNSTDTDVAESK